MSADSANQSAELECVETFVHASPDELTPARPFPRLASPPPDLTDDTHKTEHSPANETSMQLEEIIRLIGEMTKATVESNRETERMRKALLDPGGQLDSVAQKIASLELTQSTNLSILSDKFDRDLAMLRDEITKDRIRAGMGSEPHLRVDLPISVLVVDDNAELCALIQKVLHEAGMTVHAAIDGEDALSILRGELPIDVVLSDLRMPGNGKGLVAHVLAEHPRVEVVLMSGAEGRAAADALELGAHGFIAKPFRDNEQLILATKRAAQHRRLRVHGKTSP